MSKITPNELKIGMKADFFIYFERNNPGGYQKHFNPILRGATNIFKPLQDGVLKSLNHSKLPKITPNELKTGMKVDYIIYFEKTLQGNIKRTLTLL